MEVDDATAAQTSQALDVNGTNQSISVVHVTLPDGQPVPTVIQQTGQQASVIHTAGITANATTDDRDIGDDPDGKKRREILARRPSYRKILNDLSSDAPTGTSPMVMTKIDEEGNSQDSQDSNDSSVNTSQSTSLANIQYQQALPTHQTIHIAAAHGDGNGVQTLTMSNAQQAAAHGATIVQYAQGPDGQFFIPASNMAAYQITTPTSLPQGVVMASANMGSPQHVTEEVSRKRELRLLKNRDAAKECRRKKKEYIKCLENRVAVLENQNKQLMEELKSLKELYCQKDMEAAKECRTKKKEYVRCLENRVAVLENQNKALILELRSLKELYCKDTVILSTSAV